MRKLIKAQSGWNVPSMSGEYGGMPGAASAIGQVANLSQLLPTLTGRLPDDSNTYGAEQAITGLVGMIPDPTVQAIAGYMKLSSNINQALGTNFNRYNNTQRDWLYGKDSSKGKWAQAGNSILGGLANSTIPGIWGLLDKTDSAQLNVETDNLRGAYSGTINDIDNAVSMGGKRYAIGQKDINNKIQESNRNNELLTALGIKNNMTINSAAYVADDIRRRQQDTIYGNAYKYNMGVGKEGLKLISKGDAARILSFKKVHHVETFAEGGKIGIDTNVIPEGALHAHKNNLEDINPELDEVTEKGIPVIVTDENGDYQQVAEIEKEELVLNKDLTTQIEELWKEGSPESMLKAGKLLATAIMENTVDNTDTMLNGQD